MRRKAVQTTIASAAAILVSGAVISSPAEAAPAAPAGKVSRYGQASLQSLSATAGTLRQKMEAATAHYIESRARRGGNLDAQAVRAYTDPQQAAIVVAGPDEVIDGIDVGSVEGRNIGIGVRSHVTTQSSGAPAAPVIGFVAAEPTSIGYQRDATGFHTVSATDDADITIDGTKNFLESWYWKYTLPEAQETNAFSDALRAGSDFWMYARRGIADAKSSGTNLVDLTIRAREWGGTASGFKGMISNAPGSDETTCQELGALGFGHGPVSVKIPRSNCASVSGVTTVGSPYEFGADWDGNTADQIAIEAIGDFQIDEGYVPYFADYIWATFDPGLLSSNKDVRWDDTGW